MKENRNVKQLEVIKKYQEYLLWLLEKISGFPRKHKYLLGERIGEQALDILESLLEIQYVCLEKKEKAFIEFQFETGKFKAINEIDLEIETDFPTQFPLARV